MTETLSTLQQKLLPLGYTLDTTQENPVFWKKIPHKNVRHQYAFSLILITLHTYTVSIEGLNEYRLRKAIRAGIIEINSEEDVDALKDVLFETETDALDRLDIMLDFLEKQLQTLLQMPQHSDAFKRAVDNLELLVQNANTLE